MKASSDEKVWMLLPDTIPEPPRGNGLVIKYVAFDLKLHGLISAIFLDAIDGFDYHTPYCPAQCCLVSKK